MPDLRCQPIVSHHAHMLKLFFIGAGLLIGFVAGFVFNVAVYYSAIAWAAFTVAGGFIGQWAASRFTRD